MRDNADIVLAIGEINDAMVAKFHSLAGNVHDLTLVLRKDEAARARLASALIEPALSAKYPNLATDSTGRAKVARELAWGIWGPDSSMSQLLLRMTKSDSHPDGALDTKQLSYRLQEDAWWRGQFEDWKVLGVQKRHIKIEKGKDGKDRNVCTPDPEYPDDLREETIREILKIPGPTN
jgi:hypothetical protein